MCRYGMHTYKPHYACFRCRKAFKRFLKREVDPTGPDRPAKCPDCGLLAADMGLDFEAPRRDDKKAWSLAESFWDVGLTFHTCGCGGPGYRPRKERDYVAFLRKVLADYQQALQHWLVQRPSSEVRAAERDDAVATWRDRIRTLEEALKGKERGVAHDGGEPKRPGRRRANKAP